MRILWISNAPWAGSGYGGQTELFTKRFVEAGHDVAICANHGIAEKATSWHGIPVFPMGGGQDAIQTFAKHFESDINILLYDTWVMKPDEWPEISMAMWAPVDHEPPPPEVLDTLMHPRVRPIAMSRNGEAWLGKFDLDPLYVPHGVDTDVFQSNLKARKVMRERLEIPDDAFLVGMVAANNGWNPQVSRKSFPQAFDAFSEFLKEHDDAYLYVHSRLHGAGLGHDLKLVAKVTGIPEDRFRAPQPNAWHLGIMDQDFMCGIYNTFDVLLNPSMGEGFGIPIIEAQACGVPVIVSNHSAMRELAAEAGWLVQGERWWNGPMRSFAYMPLIASIKQCLEQAYEARDDQDIRGRARRFALTYDADRVMEKYWVPTLEALAQPREVAPLKAVKA